MLDQTRGQYDLSFKQIPIEEAIKVETNPEYRKLLSHVPSIKLFAVQKLHLKDSDQYTGYYKTEKHGITSVVTAAYKDRLESYTWWFPFIGSVPYKGFFDEKDAIEFENELIKEGLDTWRFNAPAYSTLGYFSDPVTTPMLRNGLFSLVRTVIHELVHGTVYVNGRGDFNEQLAKFVEYKGAIQYLESQNLITPEVLEKLQVLRERKLKFVKLIDRYIRKANTLYQTKEDPSVLSIKRNKLFRNLTNDILELYPEHKDEAWIFNNARLLQYQRYKEASPIFEEIWEKSHHNWAVFWENIRAYVKEIQE